MSFLDRHDAGCRLAEVVAASGERPDVVLALPRGGVPVGVEVARSLCVPIDLVLAHKIGHPRHSEYAIAAVTEDGYLLANEDECAGIDPDWLNQEAERQVVEAARRRARYWASRPLCELEGKHVLIVDDGLATGLTMMAAIGSARARNPSRVVVGVPVAPGDTLDKVGASADRALAVLVPEPFLGAVGAYYRDFSQTSDDEVLAALESIG